MNKKLTGIFAMCALLLTGCQGAKESSKEITPPDTGWGKTVDEVLADWNLDRDQVEIFSETNSAAAIAVDTEATVFGEQTSRVMFQFINLDQTGATGKPVLCEVDITYPDDADMVLVTMSNYDSFHAILILDDIAHIRNNDIYAKHIFARERKTRVENDDFVLILEDGHVFTDFTKTAKRDDLEFTLISAIWCTTY